MKARIKATGKIVTIKPCEPLEIEGLLWPSYEDEYGRKYPFNALEENTQSQDSLDYWTRLEHQAAIAAMQGTLANNDLLMQLLKRAKSGSRITHIAVEFANACAHTFVEKLKEKEERK